MCYCDSGKRVQIQIVNRSRDGLSNGQIIDILNAVHISHIETPCWTQNIVLSICICLLAHSNNDLELPIWHFLSPVCSL